MSEKVYILGGAQTDFERNWKKEGKGMVALLKEAMADGLCNAGVSFDDINQLNKDNRVACFVGNFIAEKYTDQGHLGVFLTEVDSAFYGVPSARYEAACASSSVAIDAAQTKIKSGDYDVAIVVCWELMKTVDSQTGGTSSEGLPITKKKARVCICLSLSSLESLQMRHLRNTRSLMRGVIWMHWPISASSITKMPSVIPWLKLGSGL